MPRTSGCRPTRWSSARRRSRACSSGSSEPAPRPAENDLALRTGQPASTIAGTAANERRAGMATVGRDIESVEVTEREHWLEGPPHEVFREMRSRCPIHWTESFEEFPEEAGFWSVTTAEDIHTVSRDWRTYSSERGGVIAAAGGVPLELAPA